MLINIYSWLACSRCHLKHGEERGGDLRILIFLLFESHLTGRITSVGLRPLKTPASPPFREIRVPLNTVKNIDLDPDILVDDSLIVWSEWRIVEAFLPCLHCLFVYG
jgi:hypothetical protein